MCQIGDIILIYNAKNKRPVGAHPFIVLDDNNGTVMGLYNYDFIGLLLTSASTEERKEHLKQYAGNFPIAKEDKIVNPNKNDNRDGYVKADQLFYFDKRKIRYIHLGRIDSDIFDLIIEFMEELKDNGIKVKQILDNASKIELPEETVE